MHGAPPALVEKRTHEPVFTPGPLNKISIVAKTKKVQHVPDLKLDPSYIEGEAAAVVLADTAGARTLVVVPMLKDNEVVGVFGMYRQEVKPFTEKQIELLTNFAAQAVIAIENTRLLSELRETLEQQTATSEVLKVISSSPGELEPVFQAMLENATRICEAKIGILWGFEDGSYTAISMLGISPAYAEYLNSGPFRPGPATGLGRVASERQTIHIVDTLAEQAYADRDPFRVATAELGGARTLLNVPMLKEGKMIGAIGIYRQEVRPFTEKQIELVTNFAAQAVIAIENARLLSELRDTLERQTATSEVLRVISSSPGAVKPVFDSILANATRICEAEFGTLMLCEGDGLRAVALHGGRAAYAEQRQREPVIRPAPNVPVRRALNTRQVQHVADLRTEPAYIERDTAIVTMVEAAGARTFLAVPMLKDNEAVGAIVIYRQEVRPFSDKQIELVRKLRRAGGDRHRERAAAQRAARNARAADRDLGGAESHLKLAGRARTGVQRHAGKRHAHLRGKTGHAVPARNGRLPRRRRARRFSLCGI